MRWALILPAVVAVAPTRVVATTGTILLVPLVRVDDVARVIVVVDAFVHGWGLVPHFLLLQVDRSFLLTWHRWCELVELRPASSRRGAHGLLHRSTLEKGA
jgi:hypothetical protein